jgi:hypothetical protein
MASREHALTTQVLPTLFRAASLSGTNGLITLSNPTLGLSGFLLTLYAFVIEWHQQRQDNHLLFCQ